MSQNILGEEIPDTAVDALQHFGVKGMKWGVRKNESGGSSSKPSKPRGAFRRGLTKAGVANTVSNATVEKGAQKLLFLPAKNRQELASGTKMRMLGEARTLNKSPQYHGKDLKTNPALKASYTKDLQKIAETVYGEELAKARSQAVVDVVTAFMSPPAGGRQTVSFSSSPGRVRHDGTEEHLKLVLKLDDLGQVSDIYVIQPSVSHASIMVDDLFPEGAPESAVAALEHFGVKGMKWGVRNNDSGGGKISRKQNRQMNRDAKKEFYDKKATSLYNESKKKGDKVLVELQVPGDFAKTVITGKEFATHLETGGVFDVKTAEIFARQPKANSQYVLNDNKTGTYKKQDFRKTS